MDSLKKYGPYVAILILLAFVSWLTPAYRKSVKDSENLTRQISDLQDRLITASKTKTNSKTYFPDGHLASETSSETDTNTSEDKNTRSDLSLASRTHQEVTTKRGLLSACVYLDLDKEVAGSITYQFLPPISLGAMFANGKPYVGLGLSF